MTVVDQWICWLPTETGSKPPRAAFNQSTWIDSFIDPLDPGHWGSFSEASTFVDKHPEYGLGFVLTEHDPFALIDLDKVRDPDTGEVPPVVASLIDRAGSYADVSMSGTGVHVLVRGELPSHIDRLSKTPLPEDEDFSEASIEIYDSGQYTVMTGAHLVDTPTTINDGQALLDELVDEYGPEVDPDPSPSSESEASEVPISVDVESRLRGAMYLDSKLRLLYGGCYSDAGFAGDRSAAECSLAERLGWWFYRDSETVEKLISRSMKESPRTDRGKPRKWIKEGGGYRESVLQYAEANPERLYDGELSRHRSLVSDRLMSAVLDALISMGCASTKEIQDYLAEEHEIERSTRQIRRAAGLMEDSGLISYHRSGNYRYWQFSEVSQTEDERSPSERSEPDEGSTTRPEEKSFSGESERSEGGLIPEWYDPDEYGGTPVQEAAEMDSPESPREPTVFAQELVAHIDAGTVSEIPLGCLVESIGEVVDADLVRRALEKEDREKARRLLDTRLRDLEDRQASRESLPSIDEVAAQLEASEEEPEVSEAVEEQPEGRHQSSPISSPESEVSEQIESVTVVWPVAVLDRPLDILPPPSVGVAKGRLTGIV